MLDRGSLDCTKTAAERRAFGDKLRDLRAARRLSVEAIASATRIQARYIEALENGDYAMLPGEVFARGFVRNVAKAVDADPEEMVADFGRCWKGVASAVAPSEIEPESLKQHVQKAPADRRRGRDRAAGRGAGGGGHVRGIATYLAGLAAIGAVALVIRYAVDHRGREDVARKAPVAARVAPVAAAPVATPVVEAQKAPEIPDVVSTPAPELAAEVPETLDEPRIVGEAPSAPVAVAPEVPKPAAEAPSAAVTAAPAEAPQPVAAAPADAPKPVAVAPSESPKPATTAAETADVSVSAQAGATGPQSLELVVTRPVKVKVALDNGQSEIKDLKPDTYKLSFNDQANLLIYDASALTINYNGRALGSLGDKGRRRRLSFQSKKPEGASSF